MRMPLHYQIIIAMVVAAVVGLVANPGPESLGEARCRITVAADGETARINECSVLPEEGSPAGPAFLTFDVAETDSWWRRPEWTGVQEGVISLRQVQFRVEGERIEAVYSRHYSAVSPALPIAPDQVKTVPQVSRFGVTDRQALQDDYPWLSEAFSRYEGGLGYWLDRLGRTIGGLFLRLLRMVTVPLIATSLVTAVAGLGSGSRLGGMFSRTLAYYLSTSLLAITAGLVLVNIIRPGIGAELPGAASEIVGGEGVDLSEIFLGLLYRMIPTNPIKALAEGEFLSIITFSILFGLFLQRAHGRVGETLVNFFEDAFTVMMDLTGWVIRLAPIGVAAFMLSATVSQGADVFKMLAGYMLTVFLALLVHSVVVLPLILWLVARRSPWAYAQALSPALFTAFSTASSNGTLPLTMSCVENRAGVPSRIGSFVLPLGATINMDGTALYEAVAVLFIAQAYGLDLTMGQQVLIAVTALAASVGAAGIPHAGLVMMAIVLQAVGLPLEAQGLILAVDRVLDMCRTSVNVWSDSCGCAVVARFQAAD